MSSEVWKVLLSQMRVGIKLKVTHQKAQCTASPNKRVRNFITADGRYSALQRAAKEEQVPCLENTTVMFFRNKKSPRDGRHYQKVFFLVSGIAS